ncbi:MAG TPA: TIGR03435 family protein [Bryobacteraceae bacterium]|nr:TIGR03435 family protein [Bryobacteraceae bacterium]
MCSARVLGVLSLVLIPAIFAQSQARPTFEVASIKACKPGEIVPGVQARIGNGKNSSGNAANSPVTLTLECRPVSHLIEMAYIRYADGRPNTTAPLKANIDGGPAWIDSDTYRYAVTAKAEVGTSQAVMRGPMLQMLLEDRFNLKLHHETRPGPAFGLTVAKTGPKLQRTVEGSCVPKDPDQQTPLPRQAPNGKPWCSTVNYVSSRSTMTGIVDAFGMTIGEMAPRFSQQGLPVIDRTGLDGRYDFHLEYLRDGGPPPADSDPTHAAPPIATVLQQQLGLILKPTRGPVDFIVIDRVEKPSEN